MLVKDGILNHYEVKVGVHTSSMLPHMSSLVQNDSQEHGLEKSKFQTKQ